MPGQNAFQPLDPIMSSGTFAPVSQPQAIPVPPAVAARQRHDQKRSAARKVGNAVINQSNTQGGYTGPALAQPAQPQNSTTDPVPQEQVAQYNAPQYQPPKKGLEYLALGLSVLFPGAPIARLAAGFAGGLGQGAEAKYERATQNAQDQYKVAEAQAKANFDNAQIQYQVAQQQRANGIDPRTGKPFILPPQLQRVLPPGSNRAPSNEDFARHEQQLAQFYQSVGATDLAKQHMTNAQDYVKQAMQDIKDAKDLAKTMFVQHEEDVRANNSQNAQDRRESDREAHEDAREQYREEREDARETDRENREDQRTAFRAVQERGSKRDASAKAYQTFFKTWADATKVGKDTKVIDPSDSTGETTMIKPGAALINQKDASILGKVFVWIDKATDPDSAAQHYTDVLGKLLPGMNANKAAIIKDLLLQRGNAADLNRQAQGLPIIPMQFAPIKELEGAKSGASPAQPAPATTPLGEETATHQRAPRSATDPTLIWYTKKNGKWTPDQ